MTTEQNGIFSLEHRRELARGEVAARLEAQARAKEVVARIASEGRVREVLEIVARAERRILSRIGGRDHMHFLAQAKAAIARLLREDRPPTFGSADEVARALRSPAEQHAVGAFASDYEPAPHGSNGFHVPDAAE